MSNLGNLGVTDCITLGKQLVLPTETVSATGGLGLLAGPIFVGQPAPAVFTAARQTALLNIVPAPTSVPGGNALNISADGLGALPYPTFGLFVNANFNYISCTQASSITMSTANITFLSPSMSCFTNEVHIGTVSQAGAKAETGAKADVGVRVEASEASQLSDLVVAGPVTAVDFYSVATTLNETFAIAVNKKPFDILHPTKDGHRLRYVSLEGPSAEVYFRGTLKDTNVIELPDYWRGLVDSETITVNLTPIGFYQELFYEQIEWGSKIKIVNSSGGSIHCSFIVYGERKDTSKNIPEYKGLTPNDYPGDNSEYRLS